MKQSLYIFLAAIAAIVVAGVIVLAAMRPTDVEITQQHTQDDQEMLQEDIVDEDTPVYPLYMTTMTHMEGNWDFVLEAEPGFTRQVERLEYGMDIAEQYGAILTIETEEPFARANVKWDRNVMQEILDRGHGVGSHCDRGNNNASSYEDFVQQLTTIKGLVDDLVGPEHNRGCSGAGSPFDWAQGLVEAGFEYVDGIVGFHMLAFPLSERPSGWDDLTIYKEYYHDNVPVELEERIHPVRLSDTRDWEEDETGIVVSSGEMGQLTYLAEGDREDCIEAGNCVLDEADVDVAVATILEAAELHDTSRVAKMTYYFPTESFKEENEEALHYFFSEMQRLEQEGVIVWASQLDVYKAFLEWESQQ